METNPATVEPPPLRLTGYEDWVMEWGDALDAINARYPRRPKDDDDDAAIERLIVIGRAQYAAWAREARAA